MDLQALITNLASCAVVTTMFLLTVRGYERTLKELRAEKRALVKTALLSRGVTYVDPVFEVEAAARPVEEYFYDPEGLERIPATKPKD